MGVAASWFGNRTTTCDNASRSTVKKLSASTKRTRQQNITDVLYSLDGVTQLKQTAPEARVSGQSAGGQKPTRNTSELHPHTCGGGGEHSTLSLPKKILSTTQQ